MASSDGYGNPITQLEASWETPRESWGMGEWRKAAEVLERVVRLQQAGNQHPDCKAEQPNRKPPRSAGQEAR
jgi:hypothetical protein